jgi:hypothetical protein
VEVGGSGVAVQSMLCFGVVQVQRGGSRKDAGQRQRGTGESETPAAAAMTRGVAGS